MVLKDVHGLHISLRVPPDLSGLIAQAQFTTGDFTLKTKSHWLDPVTIRVFHKHVRVGVDTYQLNHPHLQARFLQQFSDASLFGALAGVHSSTGDAPSTIVLPSGQQNSFPGSIKDHS